MRTLKCDIFTMSPSGRYHLRFMCVLCLENTERFSKSDHPSYPTNFQRIRAFLRRFKHVCKPCLPFYYITALILPLKLQNSGYFVHMWIHTPSILYKENVWWKRYGYKFMDIQGLKICLRILPHGLTRQVTFTFLS